MILVKQPENPTHVITALTALVCEDIRDGKLAPLAGNAATLFATGAAVSLVVTLLNCLLLSLPLSFSLVRSFKTQVH